MYAIVEIAGQQMKVEKGRKIYVHRLSGAEGDTVVFDKVLLVDNEGDVKVGAPLVEGASVKVTVLEHVKGDKVLVFKKKRRKSICGFCLFVCIYLCVSITHVCSCINKINK